MIPLTKCSYVVLWFQEFSQVSWENLESWDTVFSGEWINYHWHPIVSLNDEFRLSTISSHLTDEYLWAMNTVISTRKPLDWIRNASYHHPLITTSSVSVPIWHFFHRLIGRKYQCSGIIAWILPGNSKIVYLRIITLAISSSFWNRVLNFSP